MNIASSTDDGFPVECDVCGTSAIVNVSLPPGDSVCPSCGSFLWVKAIVEISSRDQWVPDVGIAELAARNKEGAIRELVDAAGVSLEWSSETSDRFYHSVLEREKLGSTGIGRGFAVPHASHHEIERCFTSIGYSPSGIDFNSLDDERVFTVILLASPAADREGHLKMLEKISRTLRRLT